MSENSFENDTIEVIDLPNQDHLIFEPLDGKYLKANIISTIIIGLIFCLIATAISLIWEEFQVNLFYVLGVAGLIITFIILIEILGFKHKGYALRQKDITYKTGLIFRSITSLPFNRVQHCEINQGPIDRYMNLSGIKIFTAGGSNSDLEIPGLNADIASTIKGFIIKKTAMDEEE